MASITLEYDYCDVNAQKTLEYILSLGFFKPAVVEEEETCEDTKESILGNIKAGLEEVILFQKGQLKTTSAKDFLNEL